MRVFLIQIIVDLSTLSPLFYMQEACIYTDICVNLFPSLETDSYSQFLTFSHPLFNEQFYCYSIPGLYW